MPRSATIYTVFVASPSDVVEERNRLEAIIDEFNSMHSRRTGIRLELLRWEQDVSPAVGRDPQAVINDQIPQDYDVFVGIFWNRIGSLTSRAASGTVEEYEMAKKRFDMDPDSVRLMLYFKDTPPITMKDFDPDQYKKVQEFRERVGKEAFYREFASSEAFENAVRVDLTKLILNLASIQEGGLDSTSAEHLEGPQSEENNTQDDDTYDEGLFDLEETFEEEMDSLNATLFRMGDAIAEIGEKINKRTDETKALNISDDGKNLSRNEKQKIRADAKRIMKRSSVDMNRFVAGMKKDIPLYRRHLGKSITVFTRAVPIYLELIDDEDKQGLKDTIRPLLNGMDGMLNSMESFRNSVSGLPQLTRSLVRSSRETEKVLQEVIDITRSGYTSLEGVLSML